MKINYISSDQLIFITDSILEDSKYYLTFFNDQHPSILSSDQKFSLFNVIDKLRNRFFNGREYITDTCENKFNKSQEDRLIFNYSGIYKLYLLLKTEIDIIDFYDLEDHYSEYYNTNLLEMSLELKKQLISIEQNICKELALNQNSNTKIHFEKNSFKIKNEFFFAMAVIFAKKENGFYSFCNLEKYKGKGGKRYNASQLSKLFFNDSKGDKGYIAYTTNNDLSGFRKDNLMDDNKNKHVFYQLKFRDDFRNEFFEHLKLNKIKCHHLFKDELKKYDIIIPIEIDGC